MAQNNNQSTIDASLLINIQGVVSEFEPLGKEESDEFRN